MYGFYLLEIFRANFTSKANKKNEVRELPLTSFALCHDNFFAGWLFCDALCCFGFCCLWSAICRLARSSFAQLPWFFLFLLLFVFDHPWYGLLFIVKSFRGNIGFVGPSECFAIRFYKNLAKKIRVIANRFKYRTMQIRFEVNIFFQTILEFEMHPKRFKYLNSYNARQLGILFVVHQVFCINNILVLHSSPYDNQILP